MKQNVIKGLVLTTGLGALLFFQACLPGNEDTYDANKYFKIDSETLKNYIETNSIDAEVDSATGVYLVTHSPGEGYKTLNGVDIELHYRGFTLDGEQFVNSFAGFPVNIKLGDENTYPAPLTDAVLIAIFSMHEGDSTTIYSPSYYGFQDQQYNNVPPNTPIAYTIKFVDIKKLDEDYVKIDQYITTKGFTAEIDPEFGTRTVVHVPGSTTGIDNNDYITLNYTGKLLDDQQFDTSYGKNPLGFTIAKGELIPGFELGVRELNNLDSATIFVPSIYGYGAKASGTIPANSVLVFGIKIVSVQKYL
ncbi:MAG: FKBP-type peptidyl-prolyl cis-trans isomerase [Cyclobacteriaceae bacterium]|nr:FKBP-type peptidyl-prolyl cis-trans isomerase [Cyclobacteriaceae bacterium]